MGTEIERKFLVVGEAWRDLAPPVRYRQGYLSTDPDRTVRVRTVGTRGFLTVKGRTIGAARAEFEYEIPLADAAALLDTLCLRPLIEKDRRHIPHAGHLWEVDEFLGDNAGLVVAEVELTAEDEAVAAPVWLGPEVTYDRRYFNASLVETPFCDW